MQRSCTHTLSLSLSLSHTHTHTLTHRYRSCPGHNSPGPGNAGCRSKLATEVGQAHELHQGDPSVLQRLGAVGPAAGSRAWRSGDGGDGRGGADRAWGGAGFDATVAIEVGVGVGVGVWVGICVCTHVCMHVFIEVCLLCVLHCLSVKIIYCKASHTETTPEASKTPCILNASCVCVSI